MEKWMSNIPDNKKLVLINIPGTHDSCAFHMNRLGSDFATTQYYNIKQQLEIGIRKIDIRITSRYKLQEIDEDIITCHGMCDCYVSSKFGDMRKLTYKSVLLDVREFLEKNPTETVMIGTYKGRGDIRNLIRSNEIFQKYVGDIAIKYNENLLLGDARGKIIILTEYINEGNIKGSQPINRDLIIGTGIDDVHKRYYNCKTFKINGNAKVLEMKDMFTKYNMTLQQAEIAEQNKNIQFPISYSISCTGEHDICLPFPITQASYVLPFLLKSGVLKNGYYYGWLNMDFAYLEVTSKFIATNFYYI